MHTHSLAGLDLSGINFRGAQLRGANLKETILKGANLIGADLTNANLSDADLSGAQLTGVTLKKGQLTRANLEKADLMDADLTGATCFQSNFRKAFFVRTNLTEAFLLDADIRSGPSPTDVTRLNHTTGLTQAQVEQMVGDTGVALPDSMAFPPHWPLWEGLPIDDQEGLRADFSTFAFISYAHGDRDIANLIRSQFEVSRIPTWWDQELLAGESWRETIGERLNSAAAIVTLWTEKSSTSKAVVEEASRAQKDAKLVHVRLDSAEIPYGFSETQYADLRKWDEELDHPEMQKLIQAVRDKLFPPSREDIAARVTSAAPVATIIEDGLITAKDSPPYAAPQRQDPSDLEGRLTAQEILARKALSAVQHLDNNLGEALRFDLEHFLSQITFRPASWYILSDSIDDLKVHLSIEGNWPGSTKNSIENLCKGHEALRPLLQPVQPPLSSLDAPLIPPELKSEKLTDATLKEIVTTTENIFASADAEVVLAEPALRAGEYLAVEISDARTFVAFSESSAAQRLRKIRKAILGLAGLVGTAITSISLGITGNLLTSPDAAGTLLQTLKKLFEILVSLF
ncbi:hypothetical protein ASE23_24140 [Rhizobium sp. Root73]|nr:hypothetical protein ASD36_21760 [Rhizobium sp. Root1334]KRC10644.1 hypothetical protein ASE23_24140 [Rhizobium sp. Root73]